MFFSFSENALTVLMDGTTIQASAIIAVRKIIDFRNLSIQNQFGSILLQNNISIIIILSIMFDSEY